MINWIKNLFTSSPATVAEAPYKLETPVVEEAVAETPVTLAPQTAWPFPSLQPANNNSAPATNKKKAAPKTKKPVVATTKAAAKPTTRSRKQKTK